MYCNYVRDRGLGGCIRDTTPSKILQDLLALEQHHFYKDRLSQLSRVIQNAKEDEEDFEFWINYVFEVGAQHLRARHYERMTFYEYLDLDVTVALYTLVWLGIILGLRSLAHSLFGPSEVIGEQEGNHE